MFEFAHNFLYDEDTFWVTVWLLFMALPFVGLGWSLHKEP